MLLEPENSAKARQLLNQSMALVLAGGRGSRLKQLTDNRAKPAVHFGGKFRIIDFVLFNPFLIHISEPTRLLSISYSVFCL